MTIMTVATATTLLTKAATSTTTGLQCQSCLGGFPGYRQHVPVMGCRESIREDIVGRALLDRINLRAGAMLSEPGISHKNAPTLRGRWPSVSDTVVIFSPFGYFLNWSRSGILKLK
jgi:hypothetical protein